MTLVKWFILALNLLYACSVIQKSNVYRIHPNLYIKQSNEVISKITSGTLEMCASKYLLSYCNFASWSESEEICKLHPKLYLNDDIIFGEKWRLLATEDSWSSIAKFSTNTGTFEGDFSYELWNNPSSSMNNDSCAYEDESVNCNRHYVHRQKEWLLGLNVVNKVKLSLYENGTETAWVIFDKQPGSNDNWFQPSRVTDSYPWDTELLKSSSDMETNPQDYNGKTRLYIVKPDSSFHLRQRSPHAYWMKIHEKANPPGSLVGYCEYGVVSTPYILYSKGPNPTLLSKSGVSIVAEWTNPTGNGHYNLYWAEAENFCETHFGIPMATIDEVNETRVNGPYQCCHYGWLADGSYGLPMNEMHGSCGDSIGVVFYGTSGTADIYCKPDQNLVGVADTMVISINF